MSQDTIDYILDKIAKLELDVHYLQESAERDTILVKRRKLNEDCVFPFQEHETDAGWDLVSIEDVELPFGVPVKVSTGLSLQLPRGYYASIRDRSGLGSKGLHVLGGVADCEYTGEYKVILINVNRNNYVTRICEVQGIKTEVKIQAYDIKKGDKIAQLVFSRVPQVLWSDSAFEETKRGEKGFGSSGV